MDGWMDLLIDGSIDRWKYKETGKWTDRQTKTQGKNNQHTLHMNEIINNIKIEE